jgi:hypothetical protein
LGFYTGSNVPVAVGLRSIGMAGKGNSNSSAVDARTERRCRLDNHQLLKDAIAAVTVPQLFKALKGVALKNGNNKSPVRDDDDNASFSVHREGRLAMDHGTGKSGDSYYWYCELTRQDSKQAFVPFIQFAGLGHLLNGNGKKEFYWDNRVSETDLKALAQWRTLSLNYCKRRVADKTIGRYGRCWAFPVQSGGEIIGCHYLDPENKIWSYYPKGKGALPLILGNLETCSQVHLSESTWDGLGIHEKLEGRNVAVIITRGADNTRKLASIKIPGGVPVYAWPQNDKPKEDGKIPSEIWFQGAQQQVPCRRVQTPAEHADLNDWTRAGATTEDLLAAMAEAVPAVDPNKPLSTMRGGAEQADDPEEASTEFVFHHHDSFPAPMAEEAFYGLAGDIVGIIYPNSEASREALLVQLLIGLGNQIGRNAYRLQSGAHYLNEFGVLVGKTALGRKGTSWNPISNLLEHCDPQWASTRVINGIQSGEAIVHCVRDATPGKEEDDEPIDLGVSDKRTLFLEEEFARLLTVASRNGNSISPILRDAWDAKRYLRSVAKGSHNCATEAHISLIGHITPAELVKCLSDTDQKNGFGNRIIWIATRRSKKIPIPKWIHWDHYPSILANIKKCMEAFHQPRQLELSRDGIAAWNEFYNTIPDFGDGIADALTARPEAHVLRLSMIYAALDASCLITPCHIAAARAVWNYCKRSAHWVFGNAVGDPNANKILSALKRSPKGLTQTDVSNKVFHRNVTTIEIHLALEQLQAGGLVRYTDSKASNIRNVRTWFAVA